MKGGRWPLALCAVAAACAGSEEAAPYDWHEDDRLVVLLAEGGRSGHFDVDTGDMLPGMVEKLATGRPTVQNYYRGELAEGGARCVSLIEDLIHRYGSSRTGTLVIGNALGVLGLCDDPSAVVVVRKMLSHPAESVRSAAIRAMARLAEPGDYEDLHSLMPIVNGELRRVLVQAMGKADPVKLASDLSGWVTSDEDPALLLLAARAVVEGGAGASLGDDILSFEASRDPNLRPYLAAARAAAGDTAAKEILEEGLSKEDELARTRSLEAAALGGLEGLLLRLVSDDPSETVRALAAHSAGALLPDPAAVEALRAGTRDDAPPVRQTCLRALLQVGDAAACDQFVDHLGGASSEIGLALRAVRGLWDENPALAERSVRVLLEELEEKGDRSVRDREPWLQALGQVPSETGAEWLLSLARSEEGESHRLSTHRWIVMQVSNGGPAARGVLVSAWRSEEDPERRMDYLWGASLTRDTDALEFLLEVVMDSNAPDHERLYAADRLTRLGATSRVAPLLKRACLTITDRDVRPAFERLLWTWYA